MITIQCDGYNDLALEAGGLKLIGGAEAIAQSCAQITNVRKKDKILDMRGGLPYFEAVYDNQRYAVFEAGIRKELVKVTGVNQVQSVTLVERDGVLGFTATVATDYGIITANG